MLAEVSSKRQGVALCLLLATLLASPVVLFRVGPPPRFEVYKGVTLEAGDYAYLEAQIFEEKGDLDIAFVCSSLLARAIDAPYVRRALEERIGREAAVVLLAANWQGLDLQYVILRDLLEHRRARMVVMAMPIPTFTSDRPHVQAFRWLRYGDFPEVVDGLPLASRATLYGEFVLGAPRQWLSLLRPNQVEPLSSAVPRRSPLLDQVGYYGAPWVEEPIAPPVIPAASMIYGPETASRFDFEGAPLGPYQRHFAEAIGALAREHGVHLTLLHVPVDGEQGARRVPERMRWPEVVGVPLSIVGVPSAELFQGVPPERFRHYYADQHVNHNGTSLFTRVVTPALLDVYVDHTR